MSVLRSPAPSLDGSEASTRSTALDSNLPSPAAGSPVDSSTAAIRTAASAKGKRKVGSASIIKGEPTKSKKEINRLAQQQARNKKAQYIAELETRIKLMSEKEDQFHYLRAIIGGVIEENRQLRKLCQKLAGFLTEGLPSVLPRMGMTPALYDAIITQGEQEAVNDAFNRIKDRLHQERAAKPASDAAPSTDDKKADAASTNKANSSSRASSPSTQTAGSAAVPVVAPGVTREQSSWPTRETAAQLPAGSLVDSLLSQPPLTSDSEDWRPVLDASAYSGLPSGSAPSGQPFARPPPQTALFMPSQYPHQASFSPAPPPTFQSTDPSQPPATASLPPPPPISPVPPLGVWSTASALAYLSSISADQPWPALHAEAPSPASLAWAQQPLETFNNLFAPPAGAAAEPRPYQPQSSSQTFP